MAASDRLRVAILGLGTAGNRHIAAFRQVPGIEMIGMDTDEGRRGAAAAAGVRTADSVAALYDLRPDAVVVAVPHSALADIAVHALERGCHVLLEKPMATTAADARRVLDAARARGKRVMMSFVHRFRPEVAVAKAFIAAGRIGRPRLIVDTMASGASSMPAWVWDAAVGGGGMMMYNGPHPVDRANFLFGEHGETVTAAVRTLSYPVQTEDTVSATIAYPSGALASFVQHKAPAAAHGAWETHVYGTEGSLFIRTGEKVTLTTKAGAEAPELGPEDRFLGAAREFVAAIREDREPSPNGEDGLAVLTAILRMYEYGNTDKHGTKFEGGKP
jgi:predicted dehydrogenase